MCSFVTQIDNIEIKTEKLICLLYYCTIKEVKKMEEIRCIICDELVLPGEHVFPGDHCPILPCVWHVECGNGISDAVLGSDGKLRWCETNGIV